MKKYVILAIGLSILVGLGASLFMNSDQLSADVLRSDTVIRGNLSVNKSALIMDDIYVMRNKWSSTSTRTGQDSQGFINCADGEFVIGVNSRTGAVKCSKI